MFADLDTGLGHDDPDRAALQGQGLHQHNLIIARIGGKTKREVDLFNRLGNLGDAENIEFSIERYLHVVDSYAHLIRDNSEDNVGATGGYGDETVEWRRLRLVRVSLSQTMLWDGQTDAWHEGYHLTQAIARAGLDSVAMMRRSTLL